MTSRLATLLLALGALAGCAKANPTIEIEATCAAPTPDSTTGACVWDTSTCSAEPLDTYQVDLSYYPHQFFIGVQVDNQMTNNADATTGRVNTHDAFVDTYSVEYAVDGAPAGTSVPSISGPPQIQNTVPAGGSQVIGINPIDGAASTALQAALAGTTGFTRVVATVKLHGVLGDGTSFVTPERKYPVDVCIGCFLPFTCAAGKVLHSCPGPYQWPSSSSCDSST